MNHHTFNSVAFVQRWVELTGADRTETAMRIRAIRKGGLLPDARVERQKDLSDRQIALIVVGLMCSASHLKAPEITRQYADLRRSINHSEHRKTPFDGMTLLETLTDLVRRARDPADPWRCMYLQVCSSQPFVEVICDDTRKTGKAAYLLEYGDRIVDNNGDIMKISTVHHLPGAVISGLVQRQPKRQVPTFPLTKSAISINER